MRTRVVGLLLAEVFICSWSAFAQAPRPFDHHDFSGIWLRRGGDRSISPKAPALTAEGTARMMKNIPVRSRNPNTPSADVPEKSNDPSFSCNPKGFPRLLVDTAHDWHEVIQLPDRILQLWQEERRPREIWLDG